MRKKLQVYVNFHLQICFGIRTIAPEKNCPPVRFGVSLKFRVSFRVWGQPDNCPLVRAWVRVSFGVGEGQFSSGAITLEPFVFYKLTTLQGNYAEEIASRLDVAFSCKQNRNSKR